jgi:hypothetical protein
MTPTDENNPDDRSACSAHGGGMAIEQIEESEVVPGTRPGHRSRVSPLISSPAATLFLTHVGPERSAGAATRAARRPHVGVAV